LPLKRGLATKVLKIMNPKISVCIITNAISIELHEAVKVYPSPFYEIVVGFNQIAEEAVASFQLQHPQINCHILKWEGYGPTKNKLARLAKSDWILSIDDDEVADEELVAHLQQIDLENENQIFCLQLKHKIGTYRISYGTFGQMEWKKRLYNKSVVKWDEEEVHEALQYPKSISLRQVNGILWHYTADTLAEMRTKNTQYALMSAQNMYKKGKRISRLKPFMAGFMAFIKQYLFKGGMLDGKIGYQLATEIARYTKLKYSNLLKLQAANS
jgi:glycosyltransferase involved in cell wall biosynthesis